MDKSQIRAAILKAGSIENAGVSKRDMMRAAYDLAVYQFGKEVVGEFEDYLPRPSGTWNFEACKEEALKYMRLYDWVKNSIGSYDAARRNGWLEECCKHMTGRFIWTKELCVEEALRFERPSDWKKNSCGSYGAAWRSGWLEECCAHMQDGRAKKTKQAS